MNDKKDIVYETSAEANERCMKNVALAGFNTFILVLLVLYGLLNITNLMFGDDGFSVLVSFLIVIIFLMIYFYLNLVQLIKRYYRPK